MVRKFKCDTQETILMKVRKGLLVLVLAAMMALSLTPAFAAKPTCTSNRQVCTISPPANLLPPAELMVNWNG